MYFLITVQFPYPKGNAFISNSVTLLVLHNHPLTPDKRDFVKILYAWWTS